MPYTEEEKNLIILSSMGNVPRGAKRSVLQALKSFTPDFAQCERLLIKNGYDSVYNKVKELFYSPAYRDGVLEQLEKRKVKCVTLASADYPKNLKNIYDPPATLFMLGKTELLKNRLFSIVGSRRTAAFAIEQCKRFSKELSSRFTIVSGSAEGADTAALESAENAVSVLAFGFDRINTTTNARVVNGIARKGLLVSEYFPTEKVQRFNFPVRNRIIAGLSEGTLVVSAAAKSGALITAGYAAEYDRELFAFPYNIGVASGEGCNGLIKKGAALVQDPLDILAAFGLDLKPRPQISLSQEEQKILDIIRESGETSIPELADKFGVEAYKLITVLSLLEIKGLVCRLGGNRYSAV